MLGMSAGKFSFFLTKVGKKYIIVNGNKSKQGDIAMNKKSVTDVDVNGKRVLVRCDFNVPMKDGKITDENRIMGALPTIKYLMEHNAKIVLCSHMGKPHNIFDAKVKLNKKEKKAVEALPADEQAAATEEYIAKAKKNDPVKFTLKPVADRLNQLLDNKVTFAVDAAGPDAEREEGRDLAFCKKLASYCDIYVNDAFGTAHRSHASTAAIVEYGLVKTAVCGFLIQKELEVMADSLDHPVHPFVAVLGGAKVADKLNVISNLLNKCDTLIIGGGMAYTFLKSEGYEIGKSLVDDEKIGYCKDMIQKAKDMGKKLLLPVDTVVAAEFPNPIDAEIEDPDVDEFDEEEDSSVQEASQKAQSLKEAEAFYKLVYTALLPLRRNLHDVSENLIAQLEKSEEHEGVILGAEEVHEKYRTDMLDLARDCQSALEALIKAQLWFKRGGYVERAVECPEGQTFDSIFSKSE